MTHRNARAHKLTPYVLTTALQIPFSAYFGWSTKSEADIVEKALRAAYLAVRDRAFTEIEKKLEKSIGALCQKSLNNTQKKCEKVDETIREALYNATKRACNWVETRSSVVVHGNDKNDVAKVGGNTSVCKALDFLQGLVFSNRLIHRAIDVVLDYCESSSDHQADCSSFYQKVYGQVMSFVNQTCTDSAEKDVKVLCATGRFVFNDVLGVFRAVGRLCNGGVCELSPGLLNGTGLVPRFEAAEEHICANSRHRRNGTCATLSDMKDSLVHSVCGNIIINKTVYNPSNDDTRTIVNTSTICRVVRNLLFQDDFDDNNDNDYDYSNYPDLTHGYFWKKMDAFCTNGRLDAKICDEISDVLQSKVIPQLCSGTTQDEVCKAVLKVANNWEGIDETILNVTARLEQECSLGLCEDLNIVPGYYREQAEEAIVQFCNDSNTINVPSLNYVFNSMQLARGRQPLTDQESDSIAMRIVTALNRLGEYPAEFSEKHVYHIFGGASSPAPAYPDGKWLKELMQLGEVCPMLSTTVKDTIDEFCKKHNTTCSVLKAIPWTTVPVDSTDGPVLSYINSTVKPHLEELAKEIKEWCGMPGNFSDDTWRADACKAVRDFAREEVVRAFNVLVEKISENPQYHDIQNAVTNAEQWLTCSLGESEWPVPTQGYYIPLVWTNEWMDLSEEDSDAFKASVVQTQNTSDAIYYWCLVLSLLCLLLAVVVAVSRRLTKLDYQGNERLLPAELVASHREFGEQGGYFPLGDGGGGELDVDAVVPPKGSLESTWV